MRILLLATAASLLTLASCSPSEERAESAREAAREALVRGDSDAALEAVAELREAQPDTADAAIELAGLLVQAGDAAQAMWLLEDAARRFPKRDDLALALGRAALLVGDVSRARLALEGVPKESEHHPAALVVRAQAELTLGDLDASLATLEQAEGLYPDLPEVRIPRIATLLGERRYDEAAAALERAKEAADSEDGRAALRRLEIALLGYRASQEGQREAALAALRRLVDEEPTDASAWGALVEQLFRAGRGAEARDLLRSALDADPETHHLLPVLATAHALLGEDEQAEEVLRDWLEQSPSPTGHLALLQLHVAREHEEAALAALAEAIAAFPETPLLRLYRAEYLIDLGRPEEARAELERFDELAAGNPHGEYVRARLELAEGEVEAGRERLERVLPALDSALAHFWLGQALEMQGDLAGAERRYGLALARDARDPNPPLHLMRLAERRGNWRAVANAATLVIQRAPRRFEGWSGLVTAQVNLGEGKQAEQVARKVLERFPDRVESSLLMTAALRAQRRHADAVDQLDAARERFGDSAELAAEEALTLGLAGEVESAIATARRGLQASPDFARLHAVLAAVLFLTGVEENVVEGERATDRALALSPEDPEPLRTRARFRTATGNLDGAWADCEAYLAARPEDPQVLFILAVVHQKAGRPDAAIAAYRQAAEADARAFAPRNNLAMLLDAKGDLDGAIEAAQGAYRLAERDPAAMDTLASLYLKKGLIARSISLLEEAHAEAPEQPELQLHLAMAYRDAGRTDDARRLLLDLRPRTGQQPQLRAQVDETIATLP
jgi:tetratricopeptide (TPR) repeat protein